MPNPNATQTAVLQPFDQYSGTYSCGGSIGSHPGYLPSLHGRKGSLFSGVVQPSDTVNSLSFVGIKLNNLIIPGS